MYEDQMILPARQYQELAGRIALRWLAPDAQVVRGVSAGGISGAVNP